MLQVQLLVAYQRQYTSGSANNNVGSAVLESLFVLLNCQTAKEDCNLKARITIIVFVYGKRIL